MARVALAAAAALLNAPLARAANDGLARTPPMGFRNWNQWQSHIDQPTMQLIMDAMVKPIGTVNGKPASLKDLGFSDVGLDDYWQECGAGVDGYHFHDAQGNPIINTTRFPDMKAMTAYGQSLGLTVGWYGNNCGCAERSCGDACYQGDVKAFRAFDYDSYKLDGCGSEYDLGRYYDLLAASGKPVVIENCHWGWTLPNATWCPWHFYRASTDARPTYGSLLLNLNNVSILASSNLSTPGCWAYADMLELGVTAQADPPFNDAEMRTNYAAWSIVSSPLIIGANVTDPAVMDRIWPVVSNTEIIAVNQQYAGHSGSIFKSATTNETFYNCSWVAENKVCQWPSWLQLYKPLPGGRTAVLLMNNAPTAATLTLNFADIPGWSAPGNTAVAIRDIWAQRNLGSFKQRYVAPGVAPHDNVFLILSTVAEGEEEQAALA